MNTSNKLNNTTENINTNCLYLKVINGLVIFTNVELKEKLLRLEIKNKFS